MGREVEVKVYLSNAPVKTPLAELVRVSGPRQPIERCLRRQDELGRTTTRCARGRATTII